MRAGRSGEPLCPWPQAASFQELFQENTAWQDTLPCENYLGAEGHCEEHEGADDSRGGLHSKQSFA